jgi:hypothetical protein
MADDWITRYSWGPQGWTVAFPLGAMFIGYTGSPAEATLSFYATAAQIIPVLLLVLAVEFQFFSYRAIPLPQELGTDRQATRLAIRLNRMIAALATLTALIIGELAALHPVAIGSALSGNPRVVYAAIGGALGAIVALALAGHRNERLPGHQDQGHEPGQRPQEFN